MDLLTFAGFGGFVWWIAVPIIVVLLLSEDRS